MVGEDAKNDQQQREKKIYNRYTAAIVSASVALSAITPNIVKSISPEAVDITSIAIANPIAYTLSSIALGAVVIDKAAKRFINFDLGLTKSIADAFGAAKIVEKYNSKSLQPSINNSMALDDIYRSKAMESQQVVVEKSKEDGYFVKKLKEEREFPRQKEKIDLSR